MASLEKTIFEYVQHFKTEVKSLATSTGYQVFFVICLFLAYVNSSLLYLVISVAPGAVTAISRARKKQQDNTHSFTDSNQEDSKRFTPADELDREKYDVTNHIPKSEFSAFVENELQDIIREVQEEAKSHVQSSAAGRRVLEKIKQTDFSGSEWYLCIIIATIISAFAAISVSNVFGAIVFAISIFGVPIIYSLLFKYTPDKSKVRNYMESESSFNELFKHKLVGSIISFFNEDFSFDPTGEIDLARINKSLILPQKTNYMAGEDYAKGHIGSTKVEFCEAKLSRISGYEGDEYISDEDVTKLKDKYKYSSISRRQLERNYQLWGLYLIADFNKQFKCTTVVRPKNYKWKIKNKKRKKKSYEIYDSTKRLKYKDSNTGDWVKLKKINLEDPEFERTYDVFSTDQQQARYILSSSMLERFKSFEADHYFRFFISFKNSKMHLAISQDQGILEPEINTSDNLENMTPHEIFDPNQVYTFFNELNFVFEIVGQFDLNTRIWSKA